MDKGSSDLRELYCASCGHRVRLATNPGPTLHGHANLQDGGEVVCLDYDGGCASGDSCSLTGRPGIVMAYRLARSHLNDERWPTIEGSCPACGMESELEQLDDRHVYCTICETATLLPSGMT